MRIFTSLLLTASLASPIFAQEAGESNTDDTISIEAAKWGSENADISLFIIDTSLPEFPATALFSDSNLPVENFATIEDMGLRALSFFDSNGSSRSGFAFGAIPYWWFSNVTTDAYKAKTTGARLQRILGRSQFSLAYAPKSSEGGTGDNSMLGFGFTTDLLDYADPRYDEELKDCIYEKFNNRSSKAPAEFQAEALKPAFVEFGAKEGKFNSREEFLNHYENDRLSLNKFNMILLKIRDQKKDEHDKKILQIRDEQTKAFEKCSAASEERMKQKPSLKLAVSYARKNLPANSTVTDKMGTSVWATYRNPLNFSALTSSNLFVRYDDNLSEQIDGEEEGAIIERQYDSWQFGGALARVEGDFKATASLAYVDRSYSTLNVEDETYALATITGSFKLADGVWLEGSTGWSNRDSLSDDEFTQIQIKTDLGRLLQGNR